MLLEEMEKYSDSINFDNVEAGLLMYVDEDDDDIGCYYLCDTRTEEVFYLADVDEAFFTEGDNNPIVSRNHLSTFLRYTS